MLHIESKSGQTAGRLVTMHCNCLCIMWWGRFSSSLQYCSNTQVVMLQTLAGGLWLRLALKNLQGSAYSMSLTSSIKKQQFAEVRYLTSEKLIMYNSLVSSQHSLFLWVKENSVFEFGVLGQNIVNDWFTIQFFQMVNSPFQWCHIFPSETTQAGEFTWDS